MSGEEPEKGQGQKKTPDKWNGTEQKAQREQLITALKRVEHHYETSAHQTKRTERLQRHIERLRRQQETRKFRLDLATTIGIYVAAAVAIWAVLDSRNSANKQNMTLLSQQGVMQGQLDEMTSSSRDTKNLVDATRSLASAGDKQATAMNDLKIAGQAQARATNGQAANIAQLVGGIEVSAGAIQAESVAAGKQAEATKTAAVAAQGQTAAVEKSLVASQEMASATRQGAAASEHGNDIATKAFLASERPWVGADTIDAGVLQPDKEFIVNVTVKNTGRSPALTMHGQFDLIAVAAGALINPPAECTGCSSATVLPNGNSAYHPTIDGPNISASDVAKVTAGTLSLYLLGRIDYRDDAGTSHTTTVCSIYQVKLTAFSACSTGNYAN